MLFPPFDIRGAPFSSLVYMQKMCNDRYVQSNASFNLANRTFDMFTHKCTVTFCHLCWPTGTGKFVVFFRLLIGQHGFRVGVMSQSVGLAHSQQCFNSIVLHLRVDGDLLKTVFGQECFF